MVQQAYSEKRTHERCSFPLKVFHRDTAELLGCTENIHVDGMMLVSKAPIPTMTEFKIWIELPGLEGEKKISLTAFAVWRSLSDTKPIFYCTGFHFVDISENVMASIQAYIEQQRD